MGEAAGAAARAGRPLAGRSLSSLDAPLSGPYRPYRALFPPFHLPRPFFFKEDIPFGPFRGVAARFSNLSLYVSIYLLPSK